MAIKFLNTVAVDTDVLYVDASSNRVGIGTTSPQKKLDIVNGGFTMFAVGGTSADTFSVVTHSYSFSDENEDAVYSYYGTNGHEFSTNGNPRVRITSGGNVGIGTTSPSTKLEISASGVNGVDISQSASNATQSGRLFFSTNTASEGFALFNSNGTLQINSGGIPNNTSGTNRISIVGSSGNVGIGTTNPSAKLDVYGGLHLGTTGDFDITQSPFSTTQFYISGGGTGGTITFGAPASTQQNVSVQGDLSTFAGSTSGYLGTRQSGLFNNRLNPSGDNYLNSGNLGVGTTSPQSKLQVNGGVQLSNDTATASAAKVGTFRYYTSGNNSYVDMCMQTGASTYAWVNIVTNSW